MILRGLFVKVTTFQLLRNNRRACAVNFDKSKVMKRFERTKEPLFKIHEITQIQQKAVILGEGGRGGDRGRGLFVKVIIFQLLREYRRAAAVNFDKFDLMKTSERTFFQNT